MPEQPTNTVDPNATVSEVMEEVNANEETEENLHPEQYAPLPEAFYCSDCGEPFHLVGFTYSANTSGREWGHSRIDRNSGYIDDEMDESENTDTYDHEYQCGDCENYEDNHYNKISDITRKIIRKADQEENRIYIDDNDQNRQLNGGWFRTQRSSDNRIFRTPFIYKIYEVNVPGGPLTRSVPGFHPEVFAIAKEAAIRGEIPMFNWNADCYMQLSAEIRSTPITPQAQQEPVDTADEDPENHSSVMAEQHMRWNRGINMPIVVTCKNPKCQHEFAGERNMHDHVCPKCGEEFSDQEINLTGSGTPHAFVVGTNF